MATTTNVTSTPAATDTKYTDREIWLRGMRPHVHVDRPRAAQFCGEELFAAQELLGLQAQAEAEKVAR